MDCTQGGLADSCVVRLRKQNNTVKPLPQADNDGQLTHPESSCSGVIIDPQNGLILTSGQVFADTLKRKPRGSRCLTTSKWKISTSKQTETLSYFTASDVKNVYIDVILPERLQPHLALSPISSSRTDPKLTSFGSTHNTVIRRAELVVLWKCQEFDNILKTIVPEKDGWQFSESRGDEDRTDQSGQRSDSEKETLIGQCVEPFGLSSISRNLPEENFISWFALLQLQENNNDYIHPIHPLKSIRPFTVLDGAHLQQGGSVCLHTTPFGATCPSVFLNSISKGIISNVAGSRHQLIMTDARCIPGSEGGGMYVTQAEDKLEESKLAGIIVAPLCWKNSEWIGLTLVCSIQAVMNSLRCVLESWTKEVTPALSSSNSEFSQESLPSTIQQCMRSVVLIKVGAVWGSGVVISADKGIIITCRHVVNKAENRLVRVRLDYPYKHWKYAAVIYTTSHNSPFDLAVLQLEGGVGVFSETYGSAGIRTAKSYAQGQPVIVVGHALLAPEHDLLPSVSIGVMSKVSCVNDTPIMLQSTCAVHAGTSGGALFCGKTGRLLGVVTSNARDMDSGASFPHINFSIPWTFIDQALTKFLQTEDVQTLQDLNADNEYLRALWSLDERRISNKRQSLSSKL